MAETISQERDRLTTELADYKKKLEATDKTSQDLAAAQTKITGLEASNVSLASQITDFKTKVSAFEGQISALKTEHTEAMKTLEASVDMKAAALSTAHLGAVGAQPLPAPTPSAAALPKTTEKKEGRDLIISSIQSEIDKSKHN